MTTPRKSTSFAVYKSQSANKSLSSSFDCETHGSGGDAAGRDLLGFDKAGWELLWEVAIPYELHRDDHDTMSGLPLLQRDGGVPILLDFSNAFFRSFDDTTSDEANNTPSSTVDGEAHSSGDDAVREHPIFHRDGWDPMGLNSSNVDLAPYLYSGTPFNAVSTTRTSRL